MRIAHVITRLIVGGAQENTIASVLGLLTKTGVHVDLLSGPTSGPEGSLEPEVLRVPDLLTRIPSLVRPVHPWKDLRAFLELARWFRQHRPDLVHTHSGKAGVLGRMAAARAGVPVIVHTIHGPSFGPFQGAVPNWIYHTAERRAGKVTSHFVSVAQAMTEQYLAAGIGRPDQYTRVFSGFDVGPYLGARNDRSLRARWRIGPEDLVVGKIARLFTLKGHDDLFDVAPELVRHCPRTKFLLVGDGQWRHRFEQRSRSLGLQERFVFTGLVQPAEIPGLVGIMDVLVHLSLREGLPRALPQALAAGKPVIAYDCDGAREVCLPGRTGFLLRPGDRTSLTDALLQLAGNTALREALGQAGREMVRREFTVENMVEALYTLYQRLLTSAGVQTR